MSTTPEHASVGTLRYVVNKNANTYISVQALPNAACSLLASGVTDESRGLKLFSDKSGLLHFGINPVEPSQETTTYNLDCKTPAGESSSQPIEVRMASSTEPATVTQSAAPVSGKIRAALAGDPSLPSQDELAAGGYPPRPDRAQAPDAYATWLEIVSQPITVVTAAPVAHPNTFHAPGNGGDAVTNGATTSGNWSGVAALNGSYQFVVGQWTAPSVTGQTGVCAYSSEWVGLDGYNTQDLIQDGSESDVCNSGGVNTFTYDAWVESLPASESVVFNISPGDSIYAETWEGNATGGISLYGTYGWFEITDLTSKVSYYGNLPTPSGYTFQGTAAEWIFERPTVGGGLPRLANYGSSYLYSAYTYNTALSWLTMGSQTYNTITMVNGADTLSTPTVSGTTAVSFVWNNFL